MGDQPVDVRELHAALRDQLSRATSSSTRTANLNTACPSMRQERRCPVDLAAADVARHRENAGLATVGVQDAARARPAARPRAAPPRRRRRRTARRCARSFQSRMRENTSAPTTSALRGLPGTDEAVGHRQRVDEAAAHRLHVERRAAAHAELRLQQARGARKDVVGRRRGDDDEVDVARRSVPAACERRAARFEREVARGLRCVGDVALADAGAR